MSTTFGQFIREIRESKRLSLREVCRQAEYDPSNWSKIERGILPPPTDQTVLQKWADILELESDSVELTKFMDLAVMETGMIPQDIRDREDIMQHIPAFFRTVRGQKPTKDEMDKLIDLLRNS